MTLFEKSFGTVGKLKKMRIYHLSVKMLTVKKTTRVHLQPTETKHKVDTSGFSPHSQASR